jgi:hypothetical protein
VRPSVDLEQLAALQALRRGLGDVQVLGVVEPSAVHPAVPRAPIHVGGQAEQKEALECVGPTS